jgi:hypothetical protein
LVVGQDRAPVVHEPLVKQAETGMAITATQRVEPRNPLDQALRRFVQSKNRTRNLM